LLKQHKIWGRSPLFRQNPIELFSKNTTNSFIKSVTLLKYYSINLGAVDILFQPNENAC
jgi:hypothetical protein